MLYLIKIWQLPQMLLGLLVKLCTRAKWNGTNKQYLIWKFNKGLSLGRYIFIYENCLYRDLKHEYGHSIQSKLLGPLYLLVIGIPSFLWACFYSAFGARLKVSYYWFYTEKWADKLGGVKR